MAIFGKDFGNTLNAPLHNQMLALIRPLISNRPEEIGVREYRTLLRLEGWEGISCSSGKYISSNITSTVINIPVEPSSVLDSYELPHHSLGNLSGKVAQWSNVYW